MPEDGRIAESIPTSAYRDWPPPGPPPFPRPILAVPLGRLAALGLGPWRTPSRRSPLDGLRTGRARSWG